MLSFIRVALVMVFLHSNRTVFPQTIDWNIQGTNYDHSHIALHSAGIFNAKLDMHTKQGRMLSQVLTTSLRWYKQ